jgi:hypothetical protein
MLFQVLVIYSVDVQPISSSDINIYIYNITDRLSVTTSDYQPKTTRLLSVSGVAIPVIGSTSFTLQQRISGLESYEIAPERPEEIIVTQRLMAISNDNSQYCDTPECAVSFGNRMIADGPVIAAQEPEHFSTFMNGVARSRITLLSDSSLVQGQCMGDEFFRSSAESVAFIRSLYPETSFPDTNFGRQYTVMTKILSPERGSPQKYLSALLNSGICSRFGGSGIPLLLSSFEDKESRYDPKFVIRPKNPWPEDATDQQIEQIKRQYISQFSNDQINNGGTAMFSGVIDGKLYRDATRMGGIPEILKDKGYDYLDFDMFPSGYPGDLFGHSIGLYKEKLIVGSPFNAFKDNVLSSWNEIISENGSGLTLGYDGGAGSVYIFERNMNGSGLHDTQTPWQFTQKLRPSTINISDQFGYDLDIDGDIIVVGSPSHEYGNLEINGSGAFVRRSFNDEFNIPSRNVIDLGSSGISGIYDRGALFTFENKITDWTTKKQEWTYVEKIVAKDSAIKIRDHFGRSVYIDKSNRSDSDYVIAAGSENHDYSSVNDNPLSNAGAAYTNDIVLRNQAPVQQSPNAYIDAKFFGERDPNGLPFVRLVFSNSSGVSQSHVASGLIYSNSQGEIFVEASGQDPVRRGFIEHRPYIESVDGLYYYGFPNSGNMPLFIEGKRDVQQNLNIFTNVDDTSNVYNTLGLYNTAIIDFASDLPSGMMLYVHTPEPTSISESGLCLSVSGIGINTDTLNLRIRGK